MEQVAFFPSFRNRAQLVVHGTCFSAVLINGQIYAIISPPFKGIVARQKSFINSRNGLKRPSAGTAHPALMMAGQTP